jgi:hypothetical protein
VPELINLTPHPIRIYTQEAQSKLTDIDEGLVTIIPPSGQVARLVAEEPRGVSYTAAPLRYESARRTSSLTESSSPPCTGFPRRAKTFSTSFRS